MTKTYYLCPHAYLCEVDDGAVFLDVRKDAYLGIGSDDVRAVRSFIEGWAANEAQARKDDLPFQAQGAQLAEALAQRGLLTCDRENGKHMARLELQLTAAVEFRGLTENEPPIGPPHVLRFLLACAVAAFKLRRRSLENIVNEVALRKQRHAPVQSDPLQVEILVRIFRRLTPLLYTARDACLFDSLALIEFLYRYRIFPTWILGVDTRPFQAHSWVQHGTVVLNDDLERARQHRPILAL